MSDNDNPLLGRARMPGETFRLPSRGIFYKDGELDDQVVDGEVHVHPMTTHDEIIFKNVDKLYSGRATEDVFKRLVPHINKPLLLLAKDVDYLLIALRVITYGDEMEITYNHRCQGEDGEDSKDQHYMVNIRQMMKQTKELDPTSIENFSVTLKNGQVVNMQPPRFIETIRMYQATSNNNIDDEEMYIGLMLDNIAGMIVDVDGVTDIKHIRQWLDVITAGDINKLTEKVIEVSNWGTQHKSTVSCKECGKPVEVDIPLNPITFFI